jgi:hypothetical protein
MLVTSAIAVGSPLGVFTYSDENHTVAVPVCPVFTHSLGLYRPFRHAADADLSASDITVRGVAESLRMVVLNSA